MALYDDAVSKVDDAVTTMVNLMSTFFVDTEVDSQILAAADKGLQELFITIPNDRPELKTLVKNIREDVVEDRVQNILGEGFKCETDGTEHPFLRINW